MRTARGSLGSPRRLTRSCFHLRDSSTYFRPPFLRNLYDLEFILSRVLLFRVPSFRLLAQSLSARASPCLGFSPSSRHHSCAATFRSGSHAGATFRHPVFSTARRFTPRSSLQAYFIPQPRLGSLPFRGFSPRAATLPHRKEPASRPLNRSVLTDLRRLPHDSALDFEAFIRARQRSMRLRYSQSRTSLPSSGSSPPGSRYPRLIIVTDDLRSRRFRSGPSLSRSLGSSVLSVSPASNPMNASPLHRPARGFQPSLRPSVRQNGSSRDALATQLPGSLLLTTQFAESQARCPVTRASNPLPGCPRRKPFHDSHQPGYPRDDSGATRSCDRYPPHEPSLRTHPLVTLG